MDLSAEDSLRLNVLLNQDLQAVRIDDSKMIVYGLTEKGEARVPLNPNCRDEQYIKRVKEAISSHVLGSPGGYPIFLRRWTRMGQARDESLDKLLQLGEPEAVVAVVHAPGLTDDQARRAWWCMPSSENARRMLKNETVAKGNMGKELAEFLIEFLAFEEEARDVIESVRLVLQPDLVDEKTKEILWSKGQRKNAFLVGFLKTLPDELPETASSHKEAELFQTQLQMLAEKGNNFAKQLLRVLSPEGQAFLKTVKTVMKKPSSQDVVIALMEAIEDYFLAMRISERPSHDINEIIEAAGQLCKNCENHSKEISEILEALPESESMVKAMLVLSWMGEKTLNPIFSKTDAIGSAMRRKLEPLFNPLNEQLDRLYSGGR
ncbi:MAG: hypothetical protein P8Y24_11540 [Gammaproteobacteria bacterium]